MVSPEVFLEDPTSLALGLIFSAAKNEELLEVQDTESKLTTR
jgi:hypothetical protein